jgi:hypothetical protein
MSIKNCSATNNNGGFLILNSGSAGSACNTPVAPEMHDPIIITSKGKVKLRARYDSVSVMSINPRGILRGSKSTTVI